jgi:hypothetical protein
MILKIFSKAEPWSYQLMRIVVGLLFACHGAQKLFGVLGAERASLLTQRGAAGIIEFFGGLVIAAGVAVAPVAFVCSGEIGGRVLPVALAEGILANPEWRRARGLLLLRVPLHIDARSAVEVHSSDSRQSISDSPQP